MDTYPSSQKKISPGTLALESQHNNNNSENVSGFVRLCVEEQELSDSSSHGDNSTTEEQQEQQEQQPQTRESSSLPIRPIVRSSLQEDEEEQIEVGSDITDNHAPFSGDLPVNLVRAEDVVVVTNETRQRTSPGRSSCREEVDATTIYDGTIVPRNKPWRPSKLIIISIAALLIMSILILMLGVYLWSNKVTTGDSTSWSGGSLTPPSVTPTFSPSLTKTSSVPSLSAGLDFVMIPVKRFDGSVVEEEETKRTPIAFADSGNLLFVGGICVVQIYYLSSRGNDDRYYKARREPLNLPTPYQESSSLLVHSSRDGSWIVIVVVEKDAGGLAMVFHDESTNEGEIRGGDGEGWSRIGRVLKGSGLHDAFGCSVSITDDGQFLAVGARGAGYVVWYGMQNGDWIEIRQFKGPRDTGFGTKVIIASDRPSMLLVTAPKEREESLNRGLFFAYNLSTGAVQQIGGAENEYELGMNMASSSNCDRVVLSVVLRMDYRATQVKGIKVYQQNHADENSHFVQVGNRYSGSPPWGLIALSMSADGGRVVVGATYDTDNYPSGILVLSVRENGLRPIGFHAYEVHDGERHETNEIALSHDGSSVAMVLSWNTFKSVVMSVRVYELL